MALAQFNWLDYYASDGTNYDDYFGGNSGRGIAISGDLACYRSPWG